MYLGNQGVGSTKCQTMHYVSLCLCRYIFSIFFTPPFCFLPRGFRSARRYLDALNHDNGLSMSDVWDISCIVGGQMRTEKKVMKIYEAEVFFLWGSRCFAFHPRRVRRLRRTDSFAQMFSEVAAQLKEISYHISWHVSYNNIFASNLHSSSICSCPLKKPPLRIAISLEDEHTRDLREAISDAAWTARHVTFYVWSWKLDVAWGILRDGRPPLRKDYSSTVGNDPDPKVSWYKLVHFFKLSPVHFVTSLGCILYPSVSCVKQPAKGWTGIQEKLEMPQEHWILLETIPPPGCKFASMILRSCSTSASSLMPFATVISCNIYTTRL